MIVRKDWGYEDVMVNEPEYCAKHLIIEPNRRCSLHFHKAKKETFIVERGVVLLELDHCRAETLIPGDRRTIAPGTPHRFASFMGATILEVSTHHDDADVVRLEPSGALP